MPHICIFCEGDCHCADDMEELYGNRFTYCKDSQLQSLFLSANKEVEYWKARCEAAEAVIRVFPLQGAYINSHSEKQETAFETWQQLKP